MSFIVDPEATLTGVQISSMLRVLAACTRVPQFALIFLNSRNAAAVHRVIDDIVAPRSVPCPEVVAARVSSVAAAIDRGWTSVATAVHPFRPTLVSSQAALQLAAGSAAGTMTGATTASGLIHVLVSWADRRMRVEIPCDVGGGGSVVATETVAKALLRHVANTSAAAAGGADADALKASLLQKLEQAIRGWERLEQIGAWIKRGVLAALLIAAGAAVWRFARTYLGSRAVIEGRAVVPISAAATLPQQQPCAICLADDEFELNSGGGDEQQRTHGLTRLRLACHESHQFHVSCLQELAAFSSACPLCRLPDAELFDALRVSSSFAADDSRRAGRGGASWLSRLAETCRALCNWVWLGVTRAASRIWQSPVLVSLLFHTLSHLDLLTTVASFLSKQIVGVSRSASNLTVLEFKF